MSSTSCIDPFLLGSAEPWLAPAQAPLAPPPELELESFMTAMNGVSWEDAISQMYLNATKSTELRPAVPPSQATIDPVTIDPVTIDPVTIEVVPLQPETTSPPAQKRGSKRRQPKAPADNDQKPQKTRRRSSEAKGDKDASIKTKLQLSSPVTQSSPSAHGEGDHDEAVLSSDASDIVIVANRPRSTLTQRQRNRLAASKSRRKKDMAIKQLEENERVITRQHGNLLARAEGLEAQVLTLKSLLLAHQRCGCESIRKYLAFHDTT